MKTPRKIDGVAWHDLKSWPEFYLPMATGRKTFDVRLDDRGFAVGDRCVISEYDPSKGKMTGAIMRFEITYILKGAGAAGTPPLQGVARGYVVLGLKLEF